MKENVMPFRGPLPAVSTLISLLKVESSLPGTLAAAWQDLDGQRSRIRFSDEDGWAVFHDHALKLIRETIDALSVQTGRGVGPSPEELGETLALISQITEGAVRYGLDKRLPGQTEQIREEILAQLEHITFDVRTLPGAVAVGFAPAWGESLRSYVEAVHQRWTEQFFAGIGERIRKDTEKAISSMGMDVHHLKLPEQRLPEVPRVAAPTLNLPMEKQVPLTGLGGLFLRSFSQARGIAFSILSLGGAFAVVGGKAADRSLIAGIGAVVFIIGAFGAFLMALREQRRLQQKIPVDLKGGLRKDIRQDLERHVEIMARRIREGVGGWKAEIDKEWRIYAATTKKARSRNDGPPSYKLQGLMDQLQRAEVEIRRAGAAES